MDRKMKIAIMVRSYIPMPRPHDMIYAPIDLAIATAKGLGKQGHHVTLFAPNGSEVYGENVAVETTNLRPLAHNVEEFGRFLADTDKLTNGQQMLWETHMASEMFRLAEAGEYDLLFFHHPESGLALAHEHPKVQCVFLLHDPITDWRKELFEMYAGPNVHFISISDNQRRDAPDLPYLATIYNGTDTSLFTMSDQPDEYLMFSGRIHAAKGVKEAIRIARETNHKLLIVGPPDFGQQEYFDQYIKPELDEQILYLGRMDQEQMKTYYQKAKALLTPVQWEEPFGLTTIEALASGTPVITLRRGAGPEIIEDGKTGFVCGSISEMIAAVAKLDQIDRKACRKRVVKEFSYEVMVRNYEKVLSEFVANQTQRRLPMKTMPKTLSEQLRQVLRDIVNP